MSQGLFPSYTGIPVARSTTVVRSITASLPPVREAERSILYSLPLYSNSRLPSAFPPDQLSALSDASRSAALRRGGRP